MTRWLVPLMAAFVLLLPAGCSDDDGEPGIDGGVGGDADITDASGMDAAGYDASPADAAPSDAAQPDAAFDPLQVTTTCGTPGGAVYPSALSVHPQNPRCFGDESGQAVFLTGMHIWNNLQDHPMDRDMIMDYCAYVDAMAAGQQNFMRLWAWENTKEDTGQLTSPMPFARVSGTALDGAPRYDLDQSDPAYFTRLRDRVIDAGKRGIYVAVMLFEGWSGTRLSSPDRQRDGWRHHFFHRDNNLNGIDGDPDNDGIGHEVHTLQIPAVTAYQQAYVERVIAAVHDLDNVLFEVCNECNPDAATWEWSNTVIDFVHSHEQTVWGRQHPVGFSNQMAPDWNAAMYDSNAEFVMPGHHYYTDWPDADGSKVVILDTDHISPWYFEGLDAFQREWTWKQFTRGYGVWFMLLGVDAASEGGSGFQQVGFDGAAAAMQRTAKWAHRLDLALLTPRSDLCTYCLVAEGQTYLVYVPGGGQVDVTLSQGGDYLQEWYNPRTGGTHSSQVVALTAGTLQFTAPGSADWVLYLERQ